MLMKNDDGKLTTGIVEWVADDNACRIIEKLGLSFSTETVSSESINLKISLQNRAREHSLDNDRVVCIARGIEDGLSIPALVLRRLPNVRHGQPYVIAGGNHRFHAAFKHIGSAHVMAHVVECTDEEFETLCRLLNTCVGEGSSKALRLDHAVDACNRLGMTTTKVCELYRISKDELRGAIRAKALRDRHGCNASFTPTHVIALGNALASNDAVTESFIDWVAKEKLPASELRKHAKICEKLPSEQAMLEYIADARRLKAKEKTEVVPKIRRKRMLSLLSNLESLLSGANRLTDLQFDAAETELVRKRCKAIANILKSL